MYAVADDRGLYCLLAAAYEADGTRGLSLPAAGLSGEGAGDWHDLVSGAAYRVR